MIDHIGFEVADLGRTTAFYDPVFFALGGRRMVDSERAVAYGINAPVVWFTMRGLGPGSGYGHLALRASGRVALPVAHPTSSRWSPGFRPASATRSSNSTPGYSGRTRSYRAAAASNVCRSRSRSSSACTRQFCHRRRGHLGRHYR